MLQASYLLLIIKAIRNQQEVVVGTSRMVHLLQDALLRDEPGYEAMLLAGNDGVRGDNGLVHDVEYVVQEVAQHGSRLTSTIPRRMQTDRGRDKPVAPASASSSATPTFINIQIKLIHVCIQTYIYTYIHTYIHERTATSSPLLQKRYLPARKQLGENRPCVPSRQQSNLSSPSAIVRY